MDDRKKKAEAATPAQSNDQQKDPTTSNDSPQLLSRPGISAKTLRKAGVYLAPSPLGRIETGDLVIPYHDIDGKPTGFERWRLAKPRGDQKYDQEPGSGTRAYLPPQLHEMPPNDSLAITEGEFKALSLAGEAVPAIGLPSFGSYTSEGDKKILLGGILDAINARQVDSVYFLGDSDTATNSEFSRSAHFLAAELSECGVKVHLPRIPLDGPGKGVDDCKDILGTRFGEWWQGLLSSAEEIDLKSSHWALVVQLLDREISRFKSLSGAEKTKHQRRVEEMVRKCDDKIQQSKLIAIGSKALGVSKADLRAAVKVDEGSELNVGLFKEHEPWGEPVATEELLEEVVARINRHCYLPEHAAVAVALWILNTYVHNAFSICPLIYLTSAAKRCGKTTLLELIFSLSSNPISTSNISTAALFRSIEKYKPTMVIDEADTFVGGNEELAGVINSGHRKSQAYTTRCVGDGANMDVQHFSTWCPKAIAGIGRIKDTTEDRSIIVTLERKPRSEAREHFNPDALAADLPSKCVRWAEDNLEPLAGYQRFDKLSNDRANDNWTPLIAIAGLAGEVWVSRAAEAAHAMTQDQSGESMSFGEMLLNDIKALIEEKRLLKLRSAELVQELVGLEGRPWAECGRQDSPLTANKLAKLLKPFKVYPRSIRFNDGVTRGYEASYFDEAFEKYTLPTSLSECNNATSPENNGDSSHSQCNTECNSQTTGCNSATSEDADCSSVAIREEPVAPCVAVPATIKASGSKACSSVAVQTGADGDFFSIESQPAAKSSPDLGDDDGEDEDLFAKLESGAVRA
jgi:hypothetical protein